MRYQFQETRRRKGTAIQDPDIAGSSGRDLEVGRYRQIAVSPEISQRFGGGRRPSKLLVVGVDGSRASRAATRWAASYAGDDGEVVAVHAVRLVSAFVRDIPPTGLAPWRREMRHELALDWCSPLREASVAYRAIVTDDSPATGLLRIAGHYRADMIVIGCPGAGLAQRLIGSVAEHVIRHAACPVLVVPADRHAA